MREKTKGAVGQPILSEVVANLIVHGLQLEIEGNVEFSLWQRYTEYRVLSPLPA